MIYSLGYSKWTIEQLVKTMDEKGADLLVDVRSVPYSRFNPAFNRPVLIRTLTSRYIWKGDVLGGKPGPATEEGIEWLVNVLPTVQSAGRSLIVMCVEMDPRNCHRLTDIGARLYVRGIDICHLIHDGTERFTSHYLGSIENLGGTR